MPPDDWEKKHAIPYDPWNDPPLPRAPRIYELCLNVSLEYAPLLEFEPLNIFTCIDGDVKNARPYQMRFRRGDRDATFKFYLNKVPGEQQFSVGVSPETSHARIPVAHHDVTILPM